MKPAALALIPVIALLSTGCTRKRATATESPVQTPAIVELRAQGRELFMGHGGCITCHKLGAVGDKSRGPNLGVGDGMTEPLALRAKQRRAALTAIEYVIESLVDPDAVVVKGYAKGVMKPPEEPPIALGDPQLLALAAFVAGEGAPTPVTEADVAKARARIAAVRATRKSRAEDSHVAAVLARIDWSKADGKRGKALMTRLGCENCHGDQTRKQLGAPDFAMVRARLRQEEIARWVIAPPNDKMPSYGATITPEELADVCRYVTTP